MNSESIAVKCSLVRGGTSKAVFVMENELPKDPTLREKVILGLFGSPDVRQIDGLGGADLLTSKLAIIGPPSIPGADVDYTFGQVSLKLPHVEFNSNCGNISSGVGPYAIDNGLVRPVEPVTTVRIHITNLDKMIIEEVPVVNGKAAVEGDFAIDGVPGTGAELSIDWSQVVGGKTGKLLPTGNARDIVEHEGKKYNISIVDAGTISVFVQASELGMTGTETPQEIDANPALVDLIEMVRGKGSELAGLVKHWQDAKRETYYMPFLVIVSKASDYKCFNGNTVSAGDIDLVGRMSTEGMINKTFAGSGTVCTGAAARIPGSVVYDLLSEKSRKNSLLHIGHCVGRIPVEAEAEITDAGEVIMKKIKIYRTARTIMEGYAFVRKSRLT